MQRRPKPRYSTENGVFLCLLTAGPIEAMT
jgi:hypothetical protein